jgi:quercetin 2,3-dioxygenase
MMTATRCQSASVRVLGATLKAGESLDYALGTQRHGYLVPAAGAVEVDGSRIDARDGAAIMNAAVIKGSPRPLASPVQLGGTSSVLPMVR